MLHSYLLGARTAGLSSSYATAECSCPTEHTVTKLGHSRACAYYDPDDAPRVEIALRGCGGSHVDGTPHDFEWATYADDNMGTGVCRCGMWSIHHSIWIGP